MSAEERTEMIIKQAEAAKVKIFPPTGRVCNHEVIEHNFEFVAKMDQNYLSVGNHIDEITQEKIVKGEYVDFAKLLPKDKITATEEEGRMELIMKEGRTFWAPVSNTVAINGFSKWEQAFRIFANIYTHKFPHKSSELTQYNHIIHSISSSYTWENEYSYDREFRLHLSKHLGRSWAVILQQAWSMKLQDRISPQGTSEYHQNNHVSFQAGKAGSNFSLATNSRGKSNKACKRFNRG